MFTMEPLSVQKVRDFFIRFKISLRSSKSRIKLINQFFSRF